MTKKEARRVVWERMAATARHDVDLGEWIYDELEKNGGEANEKDIKRLENACGEVGDIIERIFLKKSRKKNIGSK